MSEVLCEFCKEPIESQRELIVALSRVVNCHIWHESCYATIQQEHKKEYPMLFGPINRGARWAFYAAAFAVIGLLFLISISFFGPILRDGLSTDPSAVLALTLTLPYVVIFVLVIIIFQNIVKQMKECESKLPE